jgi:hypothetical protein
LEYIAAGCRWLLDRWAELRVRLEDGQCWQSPEKLKAVRLLGRQPFDAADVRAVAMIYMACHMLRPLHKYAFQELKSEVFAENFGNYEKRLKDRDLEAIRPQSPAAAKDVLVGIVDRATARIKTLAEAHRIRDEKLAALRAEAAAFDDSNAAERLRRYANSCNRTFRRTFADFLKTRKNVQAEEIDMIDPERAVDQPDSSPPVAVEAAQLQIQNEAAASAQELQNEPTLAREPAALFEDLDAYGQPESTRRGPRKRQNAPKSTGQLIEQTDAAIMALQTLLSD